MNGAPASADRAVLRARRISVRLQGADIVRGVDLSLQKGELLGVLGPSGAGKTTLFRALAGEVETEGEVLLKGHDVSRAPLWRRARMGLGYVPQTPTVLVDLTVEQNLDTFERLVLPKADCRGARFWADQLELGDRFKRRAGELSGGERRRLEIARALVARPRVLICDEPFAGIDPAGAQRLADLLRKQAETGTAVMLADHHVAEALHACDRAMLLLDGRVEVEANPRDFREHPLVRGRYLGTWEGRDVDS